MKHIPKENIKVSLSVGFLASLQDRHNERYSKHEAFCYLLDKACEHYLPKAVSKEMADELKDFQFITTKPQLAEDWHWHRATVRQFLEKLTEHGLIHCQEFETKYTIITMIGMKDMEFVKERTEMLRQDAMQFSREAQTGAGTLIKTAMLESMVTDYRSKMVSLPPEIKVAFDGSPLETIAEHTAEVLHCATLLYLGYIDQATTFAEGQGSGGGGSNDMKWGRNDDEDDRRWAHRCLAMANRMMRPKGSKSRKR